jgi:hypothetical protein
MFITEKTALQNYKQAKPEGTKQTHSSQKAQETSGLMIFPSAGEYKRLSSQYIDLACSSIYHKDKKTK